MIEIGKQYRTEDGREVALHHVDDFAVFGYILSAPGHYRQICAWGATDGRTFSQFYESGVSKRLIEVKPPTALTYWLLHWENPDWHPSLGLTREYLDENFRKDGRKAISGPHEITFTEGDGL